MGCPSEVKLGAALVFTVDSHSPTTGAATDADALPTYRVYEDQTQTAITSGTMAKLDDALTTGFYSASLTCSTANGYEDGKTYTIYVSATVGGVTGTISYGFKVYGAVAESLLAGAASEVAICNLALAEVGDKPITSLTDDSDRARLCARMYPACRNELIDLAHPAFATTTVQLALLVATPAFGYDYSYQLPSDCIRVLETDADTEALGWRREGSTISTDSDEVYVRYLKAETDTAKFSPKFTMALVAYLAARMAYPITRDRSFSQFRMQLYEAALAECTAAENADRSPLPVPCTWLTDNARAGWENPHRSYD